MSIHVTVGLPPSSFLDAVTVLTTIFGAPLERGDIEALRQPPEEGPFATLSSVPALAPSVDALLATIREFGDTAQTESRLNREFCLLFLGAGGPRSAPPYESYYNGSGRLFQEPAGEMAKLLNASGMQMANDFRDAPDHLVVELSLLEESILRLSDQHEAAIATARALHQRLQGWLPSFEADCRRNDGTGFYAAAAALLTALIQQPLDFLN